MLIPTVVFPLSLRPSPLSLRPSRRDDNASPPDLLARPDLGGRALLFSIKDGDGVGVALARLARAAAAIGRLVVPPPVPLLREPPVPARAVPPPVDGLGGAAAAELLSTRLGRFEGLGRFEAGDALGAAAAGDRNELSRAAGPRPSLSPEPLGRSGVPPRPPWSANMDATVTERTAPFVAGEPLTSDVSAMLPTDTRSYAS
mmetsp:Transcript_37111/g.66664  ORF Transcript_37111/g.66664 Transcript_37111/m.66664 type:complete len:201 (-) Transcript_37111:7-609(-)